jgi:ABC-type lipoprotein release transport system permease subunit
MAWVAGRYAVRSVRRNLRRTALSIVGIAVGCVLALFMESLNRGRDELFASAAAAAGSGHLRVVPAGWRERRDSRLRLADWRADLDAARALAGVSAATPRAHADVLLAMGTSVVAVDLAGVDPAIEPSTNRLVRAVARGRYLRPGETGAVVIGQGVAERLGVDPDDEVLASVVGKDGDIASAMFVVAGVIKTGSPDFDASLAQVPLDDLERFTGLAGAGEIVIALDDWHATDARRAELAARLATGDDVMTWPELFPDFKGHLEQDRVTSRVVSTIILLVVFLGVTSAQLASVLERRREFAVLAAIGMSGGRLVRLMLTEAIALSLAGGSLALAIGMPLVWKFAQNGIDLRRYFGATYSFAGTLIEPKLYGDFGWWIVPYVFGVAIGATILASLYPARFAARTDPAVALRVAQ